MPISKKVLKTRRLAWEIIVRAMERDRRLSDVTAEKLSQTNFSDREKRFTIELIQGTVRMKGRLDYELKKVYNSDWEELLFKVKVLLWMGAYQLKFMHSVPPYAAVSTSVTLARRVHINTAGLVNAILRVYGNSITDEFEDKDDIDKWSEWLSHPSWLVRKWLLFWSKPEIHSLCEWNNKKPTIWFRLNTLVMNAKDRDKWLKKNEFEFGTWEHDDRFFFVDKTSHLLNSELFNEGNFSIQDPAGGLVVKLLDPQKDETIVDACAAPGGKSSFIAQIMENSGKILAFDSNMNRLRKFAKGMSRLKVDNVDAQMMDMTTAEIAKADKVLLDVPCTGTGVMSKRADLRWRRTIKSLYEMVQIQRDLLVNISQYVNKGGVIVYSTCSLEHEENWQVVNHFLQTNSDWQVESAEKFVPKEFVDGQGALYTFPPQNGIDGGFAVRLIRK